MGQRLFTLGGGGGRGGVDILACLPNLPQTLLIMMNSPYDVQLQADMSLDPVSASALALVKLHFICLEECLFAPHGVFSVGLLVFARLS